MRETCLVPTFRQDVLNAGGAAGSIRAQKASICISLLSFRLMQEWNIGEYTCGTKTAEVFLIDLFPFGMLL